MQYGIWSKIYICSNCSREMKKNRGCKKERKKAILEIECICSGNKKCELCKGKNKFALKECPAKMNNTSVNRFYLFFGTGSLQIIFRFPMDADDIISLLNCSKRFLWQQISAISRKLKKLKKREINNV